MILALQSNRSASNDGLRLIEELGAMGSAAHEAVPVLTEVLRNYEWEAERDAAAKALARIGSAAVPPLGAVLRDARNDIRLLAAEALAEIGPAAKEALPNLRAVLKDPDRCVAGMAAFALWKVTDDVEATLPVLVAALGAPDPRWRGEDRAAEALAQMGPAAAPAIPALRERIRQPNATRYVAHVLRHIGPAAQAAVPDLIETLRSGDEYDRFEAAWALGKFGPNAVAAVPALLANLKHHRRWARHAAIGALARIGPAAQVAVPALTEALRDDNPIIRVCAAHALGRIGPAAQSAAPPLAAALRDNCTIIRWASVRALGHMGSGAAIAVPALVEMLTDSRAVIRIEDSRPRGLFENQVRELWQVGDKDDAVPALLDFLQDRKNRTLPELAARALGQIGPAAQPAVPALRRALQDPVTAIRREAGEALRKIEPATASQR